MKIDNTNPRMSTRNSVYPIGGAELSCCEPSKDQPVLRHCQKMSCGFQRKVPFGKPAAKVKKTQY